MRVQGNFYQHQGLQNSGDFYWIKFQIDDSRRQDCSNLPTFQSFSNKNKEGVIDMSLIEIVKSLKPTEFVEIDFDLIARPNEKFPIPFTNLVVRKISRMVSSSVPAIEPDKYTPQPASAPPVPVQAMADFSKPVEPLTGNLPDFTTQKSETDEPF